MFNDFFLNYFDIFFFKFGAILLEKLENFIAIFKYKIVCILFSNSNKVVNRYLLKLKFLFKYCETS